MSVEIAEQTYTVHSFTVEEYERMGEAGVFSPEVRLELIEGEIVEMSPIGSPHAACVSRLTRTLTLMLQHLALIWVQNPVRLNDRSEPQPDVVVLKPREDFYENGHPKPEDVLLVIEVSDSTLQYDRRVKVPLYARAGIPEVWIVNLVDESVETFADPSEGAYRMAEAYTRDEWVQSHALCDLNLDVDRIFG